MPASIDVAVLRVAGLRVGFGVEATSFGTAILSWHDFFLAVASPSATGAAPSAPRLNGAG